jgi:hypothetical protein
MMKGLVFLIVTSFSVQTFAQNLAIGSWEMHSTYQNGLAIAKSNNKVYSASSNAIYSYNTIDNSIERLSKTNGLSNIDITTILYVNKHKCLIVAYLNGTFDMVFDNKNIYTVEDIYRANIIGNKKINNLRYLDEYLYISTAFGVVVYDINKKETKETIYFSENSAVESYDIQLFNDTFYIASSEGVFFAAKSSSFINHHASWKKDEFFNERPNTNLIEVFNNKLYVNFNQDNIYDADTLYVKTSNGWSKITQLIGLANNHFNSQNDLISVAHNDGVIVYDSLWNKVKHIYQHTNEVKIAPAATFFDENDKDVLWIVDRREGLVKNTKIWISEFIKQTGPYKRNAQQMDIVNNKLWVASGMRVGSQWQNDFRLDGFYSYENGEWKNFNNKNTQGIDALFDFIALDIDPTDKEHLFLASLGGGVIEFQDGKVVNHFQEQNSSLEMVSIPSSGWYWIGITDVKFDNNGNLWVANSSVNNLLSVYTASSKTWVGYNIKNIANDIITGAILPIGDNQIWMMFPKSKGIMMYNHNGTLGNLSDDTYLKLTTANGLPSNTIYSMAEDLNGSVWIGTDKGIAVVSNANAIFNNGNVSASQILIEQDGYNEYLMENEIVTSIAVDGNNRKWLGTSTSGVYLLNESGTEELLKFNTKNSPLPSNTITDIKINHINGEVFFATEKGIVSYRGTATAGSVDFNNINVFPNPVKENYFGPVAINGLTENANVKITDIAGNLVFETTALGGQAIWYANDNNNQRVSTGVYLVFVTSSDGFVSEVTKILVVN